METQDIVRGRKGQITNGVDPAKSDRTGTPKRQGIVELESGLVSQRQILALLGFSRQRLHQISEHYVPLPARRRSPKGGNIAYYCPVEFLQWYRSYRYRMAATYAKLASRNAPSTGEIDADVVTLAIRLGIFADPEAQRVLRGGDG